jgi:hypothetical protein
VVDVVEQDGVLPRRDHEVAGGLAAP